MARSQHHMNPVDGRKRTAISYRGQAFGMQVDRLEERRGAEALPPSHAGRAAMDAPAHSDIDSYTDAPDAFLDVVLGAMTRNG